MAINIYWHGEQISLFSQTGIPTMTRVRNNGYKERPDLVSTSE